jgi:hypothetical protein
MGGEDLGSALRQRIDPQTGEVLFSMDQVRDIVRRAVDEKERTLREQYDRVLQQKLQGVCLRASSNAHPYRRAPSPPPLTPLHVLPCRAIPSVRQVQRGLHLALAQDERPRLCLLNKAVSLLSSRTAGVYVLLGTRGMWALSQ